MTDITLNQSQKLTWRSFGPGILMASAAIGGSHLVASTQAGALYGWQLAIMIILANFFLNTLLSLWNRICLLNRQQLSGRLC